jgi:hypothetical protein
MFVPSVQADRLDPLRGPLAMDHITMTLMCEECSNTFMQSIEFKLWKWIEL